MAENIASFVIRGDPLLRLLLLQGIHLDQVCIGLIWEALLPALHIRCGSQLDPGACTISGLGSRDDLEVRHHARIHLH